MSCIVRPENADFGTITYAKGGSVVRMMQHMLTEDAYFYGLKLYMNDRAQDSAVPANMLSAMTSAAHVYGTISGLINTETLMKNWLEKKNYPLLTVTRDDTFGTVDLSQSRFTYTAGNHFLTFS